MPTVLRARGYRFWFYQADLMEPPHVHVGKAGNEAKYWLNPLNLANVRGFRAHELNEIERILTQHREYLLRVWQEEEERRDSN
jgi:hypothetical protein